MLDRLFIQHGAPEYLRRDTGPEFVARAVQHWLAQHQVETLYNEPGKPWQKGKEERFNGTVRDECLNLCQCHSLAEARVRRSAFRHQYNDKRRHSRLGYLSPLAFKTAWVAVQAEVQDPNIGT